MRLAQRLGRGPAQAGPLSASEDIVAIAARIHPRLLERLDLAAVSQLSHDELRGRLRTLVEQAVAAERIAINENERDAIVSGVVDELTGLGPLEPLLKDPTISDVLINSYDRVWIERGGLLQKTEVRFRDERHLIHTIQRMVARVGRRIDESSPMCDARLQDGSRVNAVIPPLAIDGACVSIRRFGNVALQGRDLIESGALTPDMLSYLQRAVQAKATVLIAGGTGAGKTTLLNLLSSFIPAGERIITAEDAAELRLVQPHVVRLESRPANLEGKGEVTIRDLVRNALRMRPDRIVVGEVRGGEVLDMLQAMNTGHDGSLATIHANSADEAINRLVTMLGMAGTKFSEETMATLISRAVHIVVHVSRMADGKRRISGISEVEGQDGARIRMRALWTFDKTGMSAEGAVLGQHTVRGKTLLSERFRAAGLAVPASVAPTGGTR